MHAREKGVALFGGGVSAMPRWSSSASATPSLAHDRRGTSSSSPMLSSPTMVRSGPAWTAAVRAAGAFFNAKFSILHPGTEILPHCGPSNARLRAHVTVAAAAGASLRVGAPDAKRVEWGAAPLVFDDSFEHDVIHEGADPRIVLVLDAWHPELPPERRRFELYGRLS